MIKEIISNEFNKQKKLYIRISIVFFVGIFLGVICINNLDLENSEKLKNYFVNLQKIIISIDSLKIKNIFLNSFLVKFKYILVIFILACSVVGSSIIHVLILYKGFSLGYVISAIIKSYGTRRGIAFALSILGIQNIIYIPTIIFFTVYSINFCKIIKNRNVNIKLIILKYLMVLILTLLISIASCYLEVFFSYNIFKKIEKIF